MKFSLVLAAALVATASFSAQGQHTHKPGAAAHGHKAAGETHAHRAPHGGTVRTAGQFHIELVQQADEVHVYLLDGKEATVATAGTTGAVTLLTTANKTSRATLTPTGATSSATASTSPSPGSRRPSPGGSRPSSARAWRLTSPTWQRPSRRRCATC